MPYFLMFAPADWHINLVAQTLTDPILKGNGKETSFTTIGTPTSATDDTGIPSFKGEMEEIDELSDLLDRKIFELCGLRQNPNAPVVFKVSSTSVEEVFGAAESGDGESTDENGGTTTVHVWHGEEAGGKRDRTLSVAVGTDGSVLATCTDGEMAYMIQSVQNGRRTANGKGKVKLEVTGRQKSMIFPKKPSLKSLPAAAPCRKNGATFVGQ